MTGRQLLGITVATESEEQSFDLPLRWALMKEEAALIIKGVDKCGLRRLRDIVLRERERRVKTMWTADPLSRCQTLEVKKARTRNRCTLKETGKTNALLMTHDRRVERLVSSYGR